MTGVSSLYTDRGWKHHLYSETICRVTGQNTFPMLDTLPFHRI